MGLSKSCAERQLVAVWYVQADFSRKWPRVLAFSGDSCYWFSPAKELRTWDEAKNICRSLFRDPSKDLRKSSDLVSIRNMYEQSFVMANLGDRVERWIGLHEDASRQVMYWTDNTPMTFSRWNPTEPRETDGASVLAAVNGAWCLM